MSTEAGYIVTRVYGDFRGVDFRGEEVSLLRSPESLNMWKDYKTVNRIRTRPDREKNGIEPSVFEPLGIWFYKDFIMVQTREFLYKYFKLEDGTETRSIALDRAINMMEKKGTAFIFNDLFYFMCGDEYYVFDGDTTKTVEGYVPTTTIGRKSKGGGTKYEDVNMLSDRRRNSFVGDETSTAYYLDVESIDDDNVKVYIDGTELPKVDSEGRTNYFVRKEHASIVFYTHVLPLSPQTEGQDNIVIEFTKKSQSYKDAIRKCTISQVFDNRVFVSGNPDYPNMVWHSSLSDPTYFSDLDYYKEGEDNAAVTGIVAGSDDLWVFREPSYTNTTIFRHTPSIDGEYGKIYPSQNSGISLGCVGGAINFSDDIVFFSDRGMEGINGSVDAERVVAHRSSLVDSKMLSEKNYKNMVLVEWEGYLLVCIDDKIFLADSRGVFTNEDHTEYEWFYWELGEKYKINCAAVHDGVLYLGTSLGIFTLTNDTADVESYWVTPKDKFQAPNKLKTTNKRGCVVEADGDVSVYAKVENSEFELIGEHTGVEDYFVSRIKRKKFKDIQLKFHSKTRFSLETATLECFVGGYIKR